MTTTDRCPECGRTIPAGSPGGMCPNCLLGLGLGGVKGAEGAETSAWPSAGEVVASPTPWGSPEDLARRLPDLEIRELLGQGGMGVVYHARQLKLDRSVAVKIIRPELAGDPAFAERFAREARAMARLRHPGIVALFDIGESGGLYYLVMERVEGVSLRERIRQGPIPPESAVLIALQICDALRSAHAQGVIHRDIKPENVLLDANHHVRLADFGMAKLIGPLDGLDSLTRTRQIVGTPHYMAPEQFTSDRPIDPRLDVYSVGVLIYEMLTGQLPLGRFELPSELVDVDEDLDEIVLKALHRDPDQRYTSIDKLQAALLEFAEEHLDLRTAWGRFHVVRTVSPGALTAAEESDEEGTSDYSGWLSLGMILSTGYLLTYVVNSIGYLPEAWMKDVGYAVLAGVVLVILVILASQAEHPRSRAAIPSSSLAETPPSSHAEPKPSPLEFASRTGDR